MESQIKQLYANIGKIITSSLKTNDIINGIMEEIRRYFNPEHWSLLRLDQEKEELYFEFIMGIDFNKVKDIRLKLGEGIAGKVAKNKVSIFVPDTKKEPGFTSKVDRITGFHTKSIIAVPLVDLNRIYGVIEIVNRLKGGYFTEDEHLILRTVADFAAIAFRNSELFENSMNLARTDILTGLFNRTRLKEIVQHYLKSKKKLRKKDTEKNLTIVFLDLDRFKEINDNYSHLEGDKALKFIANELKTIVRETDMIFRIGGDEFLIILETEGQKNTMALRKRLEKNLKEINLNCSNRKISIAFSYGIVTGSAGKIEKLIEKSDTTMYSFKK